MMDSRASYSKTRHTNIFFFSLLFGLGWVGLGGAGLALAGVRWDAGMDGDYICVFLKCLLGEQNAKTD